MKKIHYTDPRAEGLPTSQIDWQPKLSQKLMNFVTGREQGLEGIIKRAFIIYVTLAFIGGGIVVAIAYHFIHKYW